MLLMEKKMNNYQYFEHSKNNPEDLLDSFYAKDKIIIPKNAYESNELTQSNSELINLITTFKVLRDIGKTICDDDVSTIIDKIILILDNTDGINMSAFSQFFMVYNFTYSLYKSITDKEKKRKIINELLIKFCNERHDMYLSHGYSNAMLQVMCDNYSHKRNSKSSIEKVLGILAPLKLKRTSSYHTLDSADSFYFLPDKGDAYIFEYFISYYNLEMKSREIEQNKLPDIVFKYNRNFYICELKSMKEGGGGQNKQMVEMAHFIKFSEKSNKFHYVTFLDCQYSNILMQDTSPKVTAQRKDIENALINNPCNYFLNSKGLEKFVNDMALVKV